MTESRRIFMSSIRETAGLVYCPIQTTKCYICGFIGKSISAGKYVKNE